MIMQGLLVIAMIHTSFPALRRVGDRGARGASGRFWMGPDGSRRVQAVPDGEARG